MAHRLARLLDLRSTPKLAGNFGAGLRFHYLPARGPHARMNMDSAEYANIVLSFSRFYGQARAAGMTAPARLGLLREWVRRAIAGYWTHSGYLNWDTGLGFGRWHQRKKAPLAALALIGIASQPELQPAPEWGAWAKWMLDRGLTVYDALAARERALPSSLAYGVHVIPQPRTMAYLAAARYESNAMRAVDAGLGRMRAAEPPALYSFDPDTGRLAVTTAAYNTAIVPVNQHAFPYGGLDIARLFDSRQEVAGNIGGLGAAAFGLTLRQDGRTVLRTQYGGRSYEAGRTPLRLVRAPRGAGVTAAAAIGRAYAGPFTDLRATGAVRAGGARATVAYRFTPTWIAARWSFGARDALDPSVSFPSWGAGARLVATLTDGRALKLTSTPVALARVRSLRIVSERSGYTITQLHAPAGATLRVVRVAPQTSEPRPGRSLEIALPRARRGSLAVRIAVS
jgi:hypothetical protein